MPRKRFKWDKSALSVCFVPLERFIPHEIAAQPAGCGLMAVAYYGNSRRLLMAAGRGPGGDLRLRSSLRLRRHLPFTRSWVTTGHRQDLCPPLIAAGISLEFVSRYLCGRRRLLASRGRYFCHKRYFVPRKRFKWDESALTVCFVPIKRFIPHEIAEHPAGGGLMAVAYHGDGRR